jgi:hypothetical protein
VYLHDAGIDQLQAREEPADLSLSALESRRASPPEASWRAMTDPRPPVPMIAVVMTDTSSASRYCSTVALATRGSRPGKSPAATPVFGSLSYRLTILHGFSFTGVLGYG